MSMTTMTPATTQKKPHILALILLIGFPSVSVVLISPALPLISQVFHITASYAQQIIFLFIIGYALGQLLYPPFANRYGRKVAIYLGLALYFMSLFLCFIGIHWYSFPMILIGRFGMALGSAVGMVISFTLINDVYQPKQARSIIGYTVLSYAFMPAVGIFIGGWVTHLFSWKACFNAYGIWGLIVLLATFTLPETLDKAKRKPIHIGKLLQHYLASLGHWQLVIFSVIYGLMASFIYVTASAAPFVAVNRIGMTAAHYGTLILLPYGGQLIGALIAGRMSQKLTGYQIMRLGYSLTIAGCIALFICFLLNCVTVWSLFIPLFFVMMGLPITYSAVAVMAMAGAEDKASSSAVMSFITMVICYGVSILLIWIPTQHVMTMPIIFLIIAVLAMLAFWDAKRRYQDIC
jgi:MFS family permease